MRLRTLIACTGLIATLAAPTTAHAAESYPFWVDSSNVTTTPHGAYMTAPEGCAVCHEGKTTEAGLLPPANDDSCAYCHIDTSVGGKRLYGGQRLRYESGGSPGHSMAGGSRCTGCHAVHGPVLENSDHVTEKLLKAGAYQPEAIAAADPRTAPHDVAVSAWCTSCHAHWLSSSGPSVSCSTQGDPLAASGHRLGSLIESAAAAGAKDQYAWRDPGSCRSCHSAGVTSAGPGVIENSYPHSTPGSAYMLQTGTSASSTVGSCGDPRQDGVCLRCHRSGTGGTSVGVGITY